LATKNCQPFYFIYLIYS